MKKFKIFFKKSARKEFLNLPKEAQNSLLEALAVLSANPWSKLLNIKKLKGQESLYRLRLGVYRLLYEAEKQRVTIVVVKIGHRKEVYRLH